MNEDEPFGPHSATNLSRIQEADTGPDEDIATKLANLQEVIDALKAYGVTDKAGRKLHEPHCAEPGVFGHRLRLRCAECSVATAPQKPVRLGDDRARYGAHALKHDLEDRSAYPRTAG